MSISHGWVSVPECVVRMQRCGDSYYEIVNGQLVPIDPRRVTVFEGQK